MNDIKSKNTNINKNKSEKPSNMSSKQDINKQIEQVVNILENSGSIKNGLNICEMNLKKDGLSGSHSMLFKTFKLLLKLKDSNPVDFDEIKKSFVEDIYMKGDSNKLIKSVPSDSMSLNWIKSLSLQIMKYDEYYKILELSIFKNRTFEKILQTFNDYLEISSMQNLFKVSKTLMELTKKDLVYGRDFNFWNAVIALTAHHLVEKRGNYLVKQDIRNTDTCPDFLKTIDYKEIASNLEVLKPFRSDQERIIYCQLCEVQGDSEFKKKIVDEIYPLIELQNGNIDLYLKNLIINNCEDAELLKKTCIELLKNLNDYDTLIKLINCCFHDLKLSKTETVNILLENENFQNSRNFKLGLLEIDVLYNKDNCIEEENLNNYLEKFHTKPCCFIDLQKFVSLDSTLLSKIKNVMHNIEIGNVDYKETMLKDQIYCFNMYKLFGDKVDEKYIAILSDYAEYVVEQVCQTMQEKDDENIIENCISSCFKIEKQLEKTPNEYILHLWLVVLYSSLGFMPLAAKHYKDVLKVKNVQVDVLDHLIYSRLSSIWPVKDYVLSLDDNVYQSMQNLPRFISIAFDRKSYSKIKGMFEFQGQLEMSFNRWRKYSDFLTVSRLFNDNKLRKTFVEDLQKMLEYNYNFNTTMFKNANDTEGNQGTLVFSDNRDFETLFFNNKKVSSTDLPKFMNYCKMDEQSYLHLSFIKELTLLSYQENQTNKYDHLIDYLSQGYDKESALDKLTEIEKWSFELIFMLKKNNKSKDLADSELEAMYEKLSNIPEFDLKQNGWYYSHYISTIMTTLKSLDGMKKLPGDLKKTVKNSLQYYRTKYTKDHFASYIARFEKYQPNFENCDYNDFKQSMIEHVNKLSKTCKSL